MSQAGRFAGGGGPVPGSAVETLTGNAGGPVPPTGNNINILGAGAITVTGNPGTSTLTITTTNASTNYFTDDGNHSTPDGTGRLNVIGGPSTAGINIHTISNPNAGNNLEIALNDVLLFPNTNGAGTQGVIYFNGDTFLHNYGTDNTFLGQDSGNLTLNVGAAVQNTGTGFNTLNAIQTAFQNAAFGSRVLQLLTTGDGNSGFGASVLNSLTTGGANSSFGAFSLGNLVTGGFNVALGALSGSNYFGAESSNVLLNHAGIIGESNIMRLGTDGAGPGQQNSAFMAGVYNRAIGATSGVVQIDNQFKLGSSNGANGQILIGGGTGPVWANITSVGNTISVTNGPNSINIDVIGGRAATVFTTDAGNAIPLLGLLNVFGGSNMNTAGAGHTVTINLDNTIHWTTTDGGGTTGVIYLSNNRFMHAGGNASNTFLGELSGNFTNTATGSVGIGANVLSSLTTGVNNCCLGLDSGVDITTSSGNVSAGAGSLNNLSIGTGDNVAIGDSSLFNLVSGHENTCIGGSSGANYTGAESNNICIGNAVQGVAGDNNTIRVGTTQTATYVQGIYNQNVGATNAPVFIDNTGKLGTLGGGGGTNPAFLANLVTSVPYNNDVSAQRFLGSEAALNIISDAGGNFFAGDGAGTPASFTAPTTGLYQINFTHVVSYSGTGGSVWTLFIQTTAHTYFSYNIPVTSTTFKSQSFSTVVILTAGDTVEFGWIASFTSFPGYSVAGTVNSDIRTCVSGFKVF